MFISKKRFEAEIEKAKTEAYREQYRDQQIIELSEEIDKLKEEFYKLKEEFYKLKGAKETE